MKIDNILLIAALVSLNAVISIDSPVAAQAPVQNHVSSVKKLHKKPPIYNMVARRVVGTDDVIGERVWDVQVAMMTPPQVNVDLQPPDYVFSSLDAPTLLRWVSMLPPKSRIMFFIFTGPRIKFGSSSESASGNPPTKLQQEIDTFSQFCAKHHVDVGEFISSG